MGARLQAATNSNKPNLFLTIISKLGSLISACFAAIAIKRFKSQPSSFSVICEN